MYDRLKVINFIQDFGCAKLSHLQTLFGDDKDNFKNILTCNVISKKDDIFVYNNQKIDYKMLVALDILCNFKGKYKKYYMNYSPIYVSFLSKYNEIYHIIVSDENDEKGVVNLLNTQLQLPDTDKFVLAFKDDEMLNNIKTSYPYLYCIYPSLEILKQVP